MKHIYRLNHSMFYHRHRLNFNFFNLFFLCNCLTLKIRKLNTFCLGIILLNLQNCGLTLTFVRVDLGLASGIRKFLNFCLAICFIVIKFDGLLFRFSHVVLFTLSEIIFSHSDLSKCLLLEICFFNDGCLTIHCFRLGS